MIRNYLESIDFGPLLNGAGQMFKKKYFKYIFALVWGALLLSIFFKLTIIEGESMAPTYENGEIHLVTTISRIFGYSPGDCVLFRYEDKIYIKRILRIESNGDLWVVGDNEDDSIDSRNFGAIKQDTVIGTLII